MSVRGVNIEVGDKLRYLGGDTSDTNDYLEVGKYYTVEEIDEDGDYLFRLPNGRIWHVCKDGYNTDNFVPVKADKQIDFSSIKVGDKLRYLGGDPANEEDLTHGSVYDVEYVGDGFISINTDDNETWVIGDVYNNVDCFELVKEEKENDKSTLDLIANLAQEVAKLKREISDLRSAMQTQAHEDNERIERILDDIVMLDERTQGVNNDGQKLLSKEVYIYDTE